MLVIAVLNGLFGDGLHDPYPASREASLDSERQVRSDFTLGKRKLDLAWKEKKAHWGDI
jgi:hypothetical protein